MHFLIYFNLCIYAKTNIKKYWRKTSHTFTISKSQFIVEYEENKKRSKLCILKCNILNRSIGDVHTWILSEMIK